MIKWICITNAVVAASAAALIGGLYWMGAGTASFFGAVVLFGLTSYSNK